MRGLDCRSHLEAELFMLIQWRFDRSALARPSQHETFQSQQCGPPPRRKRAGDCLGRKGIGEGCSSPWGSSDGESLVDRALKGLGSLTDPGLAVVLWGLQSKWALTG